MSGSDSGAGRGLTPLLHRYEKEGPQRCGPFLSASDSVVLLMTSCARASSLPQCPVRFPAPTETPVGASLLAIAIRQSPQKLPGSTTATNPSFIRFASRTKHRDAINRNTMVKNSATGISYIASCRPTALNGSVIWFAPAAHRCAARDPTARRPRADRWHRPAHTTRRRISPSPWPADAARSRPGSQGRRSCRSCRQTASPAKNRATNTPSSIRPECRRPGRTRSR